MKILIIGNFHHKNKKGLNMILKHLNWDYKYGSGNREELKHFDIIYSRFTFHSITDNEQEKFIKSVCPNSYLCIETRSILGKNDIRHHGDNHFRNFTDINYLKKMLLDNNFTILFIEEANNFAIYKEENPICIRVICQKK